MKRLGLQPFVVESSSKSSFVGGGSAMSAYVAKGEAHEFQWRQRERGEGENREREEKIWLCSSE